MNYRMPWGIVLLGMVSWCAQAQDQVKRDAFAQEAELTDSGGVAFDDLGLSVSSNGSIVVATTGGAVDLYVEPTGGWSNTTTPAAQLTVSGDALTQVCISGSTIAAAGSSGVAYVYVMPTGGWKNSSQPNATLTASDKAVFTNVSISGNLVVAGSPTADAGQSAQGAAYAFVMPGSGWANMTETAKLTASDGATNDRFGVSVGVSSDTVLVGAPDATVGTSCPKHCHLFQGAAYVFVKAANGWSNMNETAKLTTMDGAPGDNFGVAVSINDNGGTALIGASQEDSVKGPGASYIFVRPNIWQNTSMYAAKLTASDGAKFDHFGTSVALSGSATNTAVVGAVDATVDGNHYSQGKVYVFVEPSGGWKTSKQTAKLTASGGIGGDVFGNSVAINGATLAIGAPYRAVGSNKAQGTTYIF